MIFIETAVFTRQIAELLDEDHLRELQLQLILNPEAGDVIQGTHGLRKIRIAAKGHGKRGGGRVIYYHFATASQIAFLLAYAKADQEDLDSDQKRALCQIIEKWR